MRINEITNWAYGATLMLTVLSGSAFILSAHSADQERLAIDEHLALDMLSERLVLAAEARTEEARLYVMRGEARHLKAFTAQEAQEQKLQKAVENIRQLGASDAELATLTKVGEDADALERLERTAIEAYQRGEIAAARKALFGPEHERFHMALLDRVKRFGEQVRARTEKAVELAKARSDWWGIAARIMLGMTAAVFMAVLNFVLRLRVALPLTRMTKIVRRLARQDYSVEVPLDNRQDEIGEMNQAIRIFRENGLERDRLDAERRAHQRIKDLILQMMHRLQGCQTQDELTEVVCRFLPQIFPDLAGHLYILDSNRMVFEEVGRWLDPHHSSGSFSSNDCWALRRGRLHLSNHRQGDICCQHLAASEAPSFCVPLTAQGEAIGLLSFEERPGHGIAPEDARLYLELIAENVGLAVINLQLRDKLTYLAQRDALTGLFNRRCLDAALDRHGCDDDETPLACLMIDIDRFKRFNDDFGHDAGDKVMQQVAQKMVETIGEAGNCYRFGGEEFAILLDTASGADAYALAEGLRRSIGAATLSHKGRVLGPISISIGIAVSPADGAVSTLLSRADAALLEAKASGRNRTIRFSADEPAGNESRYSV